MERVIEERRRERQRALEEAERFARCVESRFERVAVILFGSYARGDFNEWSDADVLVVIDDALPRNPLHRLDAIMDCLRESSLVEPIVVTLEELRVMISKRNPVVVDAATHGVILVDRVGASRLLGRSADERV